MCKCASEIMGHLYLLTWQIIFAIPAIVLFNDSSVEGLPNGLAFFIIVVAVAIVGMGMVCFRECCGWCFATRWIGNFFLFFYVLLQLGICAWSSYFAYVFLDPFFYKPNGFDGWWNMATVGGTNTDGWDKDAYRAWLITGASASLLLAVFCLFVVCSAWHIMALGSHSKKKKDDEREPLVEKGDQIQYA